MEDLRWDTAEQTVSQQALHNPVVQDHHGHEKGELPKNW